MRQAQTAPPDLAALRRRKGVSLDQISAATKIGVRYLEAIELGHFAKLPGGFYNVSYIRQYAKAIEASESDLIERYRRSAEQDRPPQSVHSEPVMPPPTGKNYR